MAKLHYANSKDSDMWYAVPHHIPDAFFYFEDANEKYVFLNALEIDAFKSKNISGIQAVALDPIVSVARQVEGEGSLSGKIALAILRKHEVSKISVSNSLRLDIADYLRSSGITLDIHPELFPERIRKQSIEIQHIKDAMRATVAAFVTIETIFKDSEIINDTLVYKGSMLTSEHLQKTIELQLFEAGYECSEGMIVASGPHTAYPHHHGAGNILPNEPIIVDIFPRNRTTHYFGDMTRTYVKGTSSKKITALYASVEKAQDAAFHIIKPGASVADIFEATAKVIRDAGFDVGEKGFIHSLGHGLGIDIHESPSLSPRSKEVLEVGNVITIEPGIYYEGIGGVRLEDVVVVTEQGFENLTNHSRTLLI